jgi:PEGA domain
LGDHFSSVRIQVPQRDALVYVDGYAAGIVDDFDGVFQRLELVPGHHEIVVYMPGYRTLRQNLYLNPGSTHTIKHTLVPLGPGETGEPQPVPRAMPPVPGPPGPFPPAVVTQRDGTLLLRVQPGDASVYIDGEQWRGPQGQDRLVIQLATGSHRVRVERPGFQSFDVQVEVRAGETTAFSVTLIQ